VTIIRCSSQVQGGNPPLKVGIQSPPSSASHQAGKLISVRLKLLIWLDSQLGHTKQLKTFLYLLKITIWTFWFDATWNRSRITNSI